MKKLKLISRGSCFAKVLGEAFVIRPLRRASELKTFTRTGHFLQRMSERGVGFPDIKHVLNNGDLIGWARDAERNNYIYRIAGKDTRGQDLQIVAAYGHGAYLVSVY